ncbi:MAG: hypothetical protein HY935_03950 [Nitrosomonadales bacterium]|nr:hypothetical protein [Nitrosomonadales bacterium]
MRRHDKYKSERAEILPCLAVMGNFLAALVESKQPVLFTIIKNERPRKCVLSPCSLSTFGVLLDGTGGNKRRYELFAP